MLKHKTLWFIFFISLELAFGARYLVAGKYGLRAYQTVVAEKKQLEDAIDMLTHEIALYEQEIYAWQNYPFYKEKAAREQLQMCYADEIIYVTRPNIK
jgi:cell division protein FtsB